MKDLVLVHDAEGKAVDLPALSHHEEGVFEAALSHSSLAFLPRERAVEPALLAVEDASDQLLKRVPSLEQGVIDLMLLERGGESEREGEKERERSMEREQVNIHVCTCINYIHYNL